MHPGLGIGQKPRMKITHTDTTFTMSGTHSTDSYPLDELTKQLAVYRQLRADFLKSGTSYDAIIDGLEALAYELGVRVDPDPARMATA